MSPTTPTSDADTLRDELALAAYAVSDPSQPPAERLDHLQANGFTVDLLSDRKCAALFKAIERRVSDGKVTDLPHVQDLTEIAFSDVLQAIDGLFDYQLPGRIADLKERRQARQVQKIIRQADSMNPSDALQFMREQIDQLSGGSTGEIRPVKASDYITAAAPLHDPVLGDLFDLGDKCWLIGSSKARKSFCALQLAISVATGRPFMAWQVAKPRRVLLVQLEIKDDHFHRRVNRMARSMRVTEIDNLSIVNGRGSNIDMAGIRRLAIKHQTELVIIDPLYKLLSGDENSAEVMGAVMRHVDRIAEESGAAVMIVHHERKGHAGDRQAVDRGAGSGTLARDYDAALYLAAHATEPETVVVSCVARNYPPTEPFAAVWDDGCFIESNAPPIEATSGSARKQAGRRPPVSDMQIVQIIEADGPFTISALQRRLQDAGMGRDMARETPKRLSSENIISMYREPVFHGVTWVGTKAQIKAKTVQTYQTRDDGTDARGRKSGKSGAKSQ